MRKLITILLLLTMLFPAVMAEETVEMPENVSAITPLPVDLSAGYVPNPDCYIAADEENGILQGYEDESITVTMERVRVGDSTFNVARIKIADPSQLRTGLENEKASRNNKVSAIAAKHNAVVAIGGDFFADAKNGYIVRQYKEFRKSPKSVYDMLLIDNNGDFHIVLRSDAEELKALLSSESPQAAPPDLIHFLGTRGAEVHCQTLYFKTCQPLLVTTQLQTSPPEAPGKGPASRPSRQTEVLFSPHLLICTGVSAQPQEAAWNRESL